MVEAALDRVLPSEDAVPVNLHRAMRYSVLAPGKRLRPTLVIAGAEAVGGPDTLEYIHRHKTAALIRVSLTAGATLAGGRAEQVDTIREAGESLGLAFQIVDDILDVEGSLAELGKTAGSDERKKKATYPAYHGLEASRHKARMLIDETKRLLEPLGTPAEPIRALADFVFERRS